MDNPSELSSHSLSQVTNPNLSVVLATARVKVRSEQGRVVEARALLDQGSVVTLVSENLAQLLRLKRTATNLCLTGLGDSRVSARQSATVIISPPLATTPSYATQAIILRSLTSYTPPRLPAHNWPHTTKLRLADWNPSSGDPIDLVIGADLYGELLRPGLRRGRSDEPTAQNTVFGWVLSGPSSTSEASASVHCNHCAMEDDIDRTLRRFWEVEDIQSSSLLTPDEQRAEDHFLSTHRRNSGGRYIVRLPFKTCPPLDLGDSLALARSNLLRLRRRLDKDCSKANDYAAFLAEYERLGHMTNLSSPDLRASRPSYYIPHHAVFRNSSTTSKLRVVFNASSPSTNGTSLNDCLLVGPKLQADLAAVLIRWRQFKYVFTADIEKMYRQILVDERDIDYQRILWQASINSPVEEYRLHTLTYGTTSAPFLALRVIRQLALDEGNRYPLALQVIQHQAYVDDYIFGAASLELALETRKQLDALLRSGGFHLRKWASNHPALLADVDPTDHGMARSKDLHIDEALPILGVCWNPDQDELRFRLNQTPNLGFTKRAILSTIAHLFDPLGWVTPVIVAAKILMQRLWQLRCGWDDEVPPAIRAEWLRFHSQLATLQRISIPRWTRYADSQCQIELHGFSDASTAAYAAAVYVRVLAQRGEVTTSLLIAKSKVAPLKTLSVPRLELCAAHLLTRLIVYVRSALNLADVDIHCWTDSTIVLAWLRQPPSRWKTFVANRVAFIQKSLETAAWRHVATTDNPADCASRGLKPEELCSHTLWWNGPHWLGGDAGSWPAVTPIREADFDLESRRIACTATTTITATWDLATRFSSWSKLLRVTAYLFRYVRYLRRRVQTKARSEEVPPDPSLRFLQPNELAAAQTFWLRQLQAAMFPQELSLLQRSLPMSKKSSLAPLCPFLDREGLIRIRGRLKHTDLSDSTRQPIVLQPHDLVRQIISDAHLRALHAGPQLTLALLRQEFWLLRARATVRSVLYRCVTCARAAAQLPEQMMGDLPECRVTEVPRAFTHTGVDYAGPLLARSAPGRGHKAHKAYIAVFICMTTKAVHLELVSDYSSQSFIAAYHRFVSRRGVPSTMYSDNGTNFQGAARELQKSCQAALKNPDFINRLAVERVSWRFIPPAAPHFGGLWEAAVRSMKHHLKRCIGAHTLTSEELSTLLCRIEACLNSRPIASLSDSLDDYRALTPGHLLIGAPLVASPEPHILDVKENRLSRWQMVQRLTEDFWKAWRHDYLHTLQQRPKWRIRLHLARAGQLVLISDSNSPPSHWALGRITACHPGDDGLTRVVTVKTARTEVKRPIVKLCFLPVDINTATEAESFRAGGAPPPAEKPQ